MASDVPPGLEGDPQTAVSVMPALPDVPASRRAFDRLAPDGAVVIDLVPTLFSPGVGMRKDRFGTHSFISAMAASA